MHVRALPLLLVPIFCSAADVIQQGHSFHGSAFDSGPRQKPVLLRNLGGGKFENITTAAGVGLSNKVCVAAAFADVDNDGLPDLFVTTVLMGNVLFHNLGNGKFEDVAGAKAVRFSHRDFGFVVQALHNTAGSSF